MKRRDDAERLKAGANLWNSWRARTKPNEPQLSEHDFSRLNLSRFNLQNANLLRSNFTDTNLTRADLSDAELEDAIFVRTNLTSANLYGATASGTIFEQVRTRNATFVDVAFYDARISDADFSGVNLEGARFYDTELVRVDLRLLDLNYAMFRGSRFVGCNLTGAEIGQTTFANVEFVDTVGLDRLKHESESTIGINTFFVSRGLPDSFLRGAGVPEDFITYASSLLGKAIEYYSCFISYASADERFARRLYADLQARNIRVWFAPEDLKIGDRFRSRIDQSIRIHDKLIVILTTESISSSWVENEVETAFARESKERRDVLFPIRLDDAVFATQHAWATNLVNTRHIGDFRNWKNHDDYISSLERLIRVLKREGPLVMK
jgi:hypothetical protein